MALFVIKTADRPEVNQWFADTLHRSKDDSLVKNPFKWKMKRIKTGRDLFLVMDAQPVIPNFSIFGWVTALAILLTWGFNVGVWIFLGIGLLGYFWTAEFFYHMTLLALRKKAKYQGKIKRIKLADLIREVVL